MPTSPTPAADRPADQLRAAAERARETGDPLHTALAELLTHQADTLNVGRINGTSLVICEPCCEKMPCQHIRPALAVARQLLGTTPGQPETGSTGPVNSGPGWYEVIHPRSATTCIAYVQENGDLYLPEGDDLTPEEFAFAAARGRAHRLIRADEAEQPAPALAVARQLLDGTPAPAVWSDGDPLMEATACAVWEQCRTENSIVVDDPRNIAAVAATVARQLLGTTVAEGDPEVVAYRNTDRPGVLLCREHGKGWLGLTPLTSEDLEDGGFCTWGQEYGYECGRDVLITPPAPTASLREVVDRLVAHAVGFQDVLDESDRGPWGALILADIAELRALANRPATDAAPPAPADRAAVLREAADIAESLREFTPAYGARKSAQISENVGVLRVADHFRALAGRAAAGVQPPTTADPLADCATEYRVPVPEAGGTELRLRKGHAPYTSGWSVAVPGYGGGRALTELGWLDSISALSADRLFCWPNPATAVDAARRALAAPAAPEERGR
ncbi:hypothetical protein ACFUIV_18380 [Streptomyces anulatus]|uniref:hypothetical protein n=1 Tax=Streptomyces anulatus TaxID=1892 RepID=UPI00363BC480